MHAWNIIDGCSMHACRSAIFLKTIGLTCLRVDDLWLLILLLSPLPVINDR